MFHGSPETLHHVDDDARAELGKLRERLYLAVHRGFQAAVNVDL